MSKILIHKPTKNIIIPYNQDVLNAIPKSKSLTYRGKLLTQIFHGEEEVAKLRELGIDAPAPIMYYYDWPLIKNRHLPFNHQKLTAEAFTLHPRIVCLNSMGMGKTESTLYSADYLLKTKKIKKILVLSPLSCIRKVWGDAIFNSFYWNSYTIVHGTKAKRIESLNNDVQFYIANHEFLRMAIKKREAANGTFIYEFNPEFSMLKDIDVIVVDEYSMYRNSSTYLFKALEALLKVVEPKYFWPLTGTPCPNAPTDAWALTKLLNPTNIEKYFGAFRKRVMLQVGNGPFAKWVPQQGSHEVVNQVLQPAIRFKKEDCLDLPPLTFQNRECELTAEQLKHFKSMKKEMVMEQDSKEITAVNAADRLIKLRQILCGAIKNGDEYIPLDCKPRINLLLELIEEAGHKVIVVVPYKGILKILQKEVAKHYSCEIINGDTPIKERDRIFTAFQENRDPHVCLLHPRVASHGLTLTKANYLIFYGPIDSSDMFAQVIERINRPGQVNNMSIVSIGGHAIEWAIYEGLQERKSFQNLALELYHKEIA